MARRKPLHTVAGWSPGLASQSHGLSAHHAGSATPARVPKSQAVPSRQALSGHEILSPPRRAHGSPDVVPGARCRGASGLPGAALLHHAPASGRCRWFASCRCRRSPVVCSWRSRPRIVRYQGGLRRAGGPAELQRRPSRIRAVQRCVVRGPVHVGPVRHPERSRENGGWCRAAARHPRGDHPSRTRRISPGVPAHAGCGWIQLSADGETVRIADEVGLGAS